MGVWKKGPFYVTNFGKLGVFLLEKDLCGKTGNYQVLKITMP